MHDDIPTYDEAVKQVTCAFEEGIHYRGNDNQLLGDLSETWVRNQKYVNMSLDDAMYCAFMESATLLVLLVKPLENIQIKLS